MYMKGSCRAPASRTSSAPPLRRCCSFSMNSRLRELYTVYVEIVDALYAP
eukprot:IDg10335t1